jgi:hypothetical protein
MGKEGSKPMNEEETLKAEIESCWNHFMDATEVISLEEFVSYLLIEVCDKSERLNVLGVLQDMILEDGRDME